MPATVDVRVLLDTHIALWARMDDRRLGAPARASIADADNAVFVSVASVWEVAIERAPGRSGISFSAGAAAGYFADAGYHHLAIRPEHAAATETLPKPHGDPCDRILVGRQRSNRCT